MSLDVYSHVIVLDEVDPETVKALASRRDDALRSFPRDARVMHGEIESPRSRGGFP